MLCNKKLQHYLNGIKQGDDQSASAIWTAYFPRLVDLADRELRASARNLEDEEDVALVTLDSFFRGVQGGRISGVRDASTLWRLLSKMARCKVIDRVRRDNALRHGGGRIKGGSWLLHELGTSAGESDAILDDRLPAAEQIVFEEQMQVWLKTLDNCGPLLRSVAEAKMDGLTNAELAERFDRSVPTIERSLRKIRNLGRPIWDEVLCR